ncbi:MAG: sulfatase-like hydrolase/transferase [Planctomycetota bacterium]
MFRSVALFALILVGTCSCPSLVIAQQRPNVVIIMADDMGYSDIGCYGGEIQTPNIDQLANGGLRFTQFYNTARCCPTRAALLTGLHQHQTGIGQMTETPKGPRDDDRPAYQGFLNRNCVTMAEVLKPAGYHTYMTGKWHLGYHGKEKWPRQRGFDRFYGSIAGATSYFKPQGGRGVTLDNQNLDPPTDPNYYTTDAFTDYAIQFLNEQTDDKPFFLYLAYTAPHWPLQAREEDIAKYVGQYRDIGWDGLRKRRLARQKELGLFDDAVGLPPRDDRARPWSDLTEKQRDELDYRMAVYAAMVDRMDQNIGRVVSWLREHSQLDNTLLFFLSDNGGCAEPYTDLGGGKLEDINNPNKSNAISYGLGWANASNTPFQKFKVFSHEGGISTPLIVHWPSGLKTEPGAISHTPAQLIDLMPTVLAATDATYPNTIAGHAIHPLEGVSLMPTISGQTREPAEWMFWEHSGHKAVRHGDYKALLPRGSKAWELYNLANDRQERHDLAESMSMRTSQMGEKWNEWAVNHDVIPIVANDHRGAEPPPSDRAGNPLQVDGHDFYAADPSVVIADDGRLFLFPTTDNRDWEKQVGWSCYSTTDLSNWTDHGVIFRNTDSDWGTHKAWAPDITKKDGKYYFFYYFNNGGQGKGGVGVAVAEQPEGPFRELTNERLCRGHDPAVFADDDGRHWMYLQDKVYELGDDMISFKSGPTNLNLAYRPDRFEAAYVFKRNETYYFTIARGWNNLIYYTGDSPTGPFEYRGEIMKPYGGNNHHSIVKYKGRWVIFYHEWLEGDPVHQRRLRAEYLGFNEDGTIRLVEPTSAGVQVANAGILSKRRSQLVRTSEMHKQRDLSPRSERSRAIGQHDRAVQLLDEKIRDPFIARGPNGVFHLTGTTAGSHWGDTVGIRLWKSPNLIDWSDMGFVWDLNQHGKEQSSWHFDRPAKEGVKNGRALWAPEIHFMNDTWWIPHSVNVAGHGLLKSTSGKPEGPYVPMPAISDRGIDAHLFQDSGRTFYLWGSDNLIELSRNLSEVRGESVKLRPRGNHELGYEGVFLTKVGDKYLLMASGRYAYESTDTYDLYYCVSDTLQGPYGKRRMAVKNAGHGNLFQDNEGRWWCTAFDHEFVTSKNRWTPWIVPIDIIASDDDLHIEVLDERFRPSFADHQEVARINQTGVPAGRQGKRPWES